jgi:hypothetical protein
MKHRDIGLVSRQTQMIACMLIAVAVIGAIVYEFNKNATLETFTNYASASSAKSPQYVAKSKYTAVSYAVDSSSDAIRIHAKFGDLTGVSAIHIHTNDNGKPGPIIAWLATTSEWKSGVLQNTPGKNAPCCGSHNPMCSLAGPADSTPLIQSVANTEMDYVVRNDFCKVKSMCPWINNGTILVIHGLNFQRVENGCLTNAPAGIDVLQAIPFAASK